MARPAHAPETVALSGTPREIGLRHGQLLCSKVRDQVEIYEKMFKQTSKLDWEAVCTLAIEYATTIKKLTPDLYSEMEGIAEGSGLDILDIVALNCRSEIALGTFSDGCTALGWKTAKEVILAQNWDWTARVKRNLVFMSIEQPGKPKIWMAGIVGKIGFNSNSVGTNLNAIRAKPAVASKIPIHVALRLCLESTSKEAAISTLEAVGGIASSAHILIADCDGPIGLKLSPNGNVYLEPNENGIICHTNHFIKNRFITEPLWLEGSPIRLERIQKLTQGLAATSQHVTSDLLRRHVFSDGFNAPQAICCQEDHTRPIETRSSTLFCIIMRFSHDRQAFAEVVWGRPGSGEEGPVLKMPW